MLQRQPSQPKLDPVSLDAPEHRLFQEKQLDRKPQEMNSVRSKILKP